MPDDTTRHLDKAPPPGPPSSRADAMEHGLSTDHAGKPERDDSVHASYWTLVRRKFMRHRLAVACGFIVGLIYLIALFAEVIAPFSPTRYDARYPYAPPQTLHLVDTQGDDWDWGLFVYGYDVTVDTAALRRTFSVDRTTKHPVGLFVKGEPYELWGLIPMQRHLLAPLDPDAPMYLLGADRLGRDVLSRTIHGARVSMSIGLVGVALSLVLGTLLGGASGYFGGWIDSAIQRIIELLRSIPTIPLWMGLAAAIPVSVPPLRVYFYVTILLSLIGWTGLAREVRGRFFSIKNEDFVTAARLDGAGTFRIITRHMLPSVASHIIASVTLAIPTMILAETSLSFLGIGLRPPVVSWGVLLQEAQNVRAVASAPWLFWPGAAVVTAVLALNFLGDGLRDAADPFDS